MTPISDSQNSDPRNKILDMLADGKITPADAKTLLELVAGGDVREPREREGREGNRDRDRGRRRGGRSGAASYLRVRVDPRVEVGANPLSDRVNIRVPIAFIKAGAVLTSLIPDSAADRVSESLNERGIDLDFKNLDADRLEEILSDGGFAIDITEGQLRIRISVE